MKPVRVVTDSSAVIPSELLGRYGIEVVPLTITWDDSDAFRNGDMTYAAFVERARDGAVPTTSAPSPGEYQEACERLLGEAERVLVITPPAEVSATHGNASLAAETIGGGRVEVFDSRSAAAGQGLVVLEAARAGSDLDAARDRADLVAERVRLYATLERLDYLKRSGRVPAVAAFATGALDLHPVFRFVKGSPTSAGAARGAKRAAEKVFKAWAESRPEEPGRGHVFVFHSSRDEEAERMRERVAEEAPGAETAVVEVTAAMAAHIGPGMLGLAWWWEDPQG